MISTSRKLWFPIIMVFCVFCNLFSQVITEDEYSLMEDVLERADLDLESLNFEKHWGISTKLLIPKVVEILNNPLEYPKLADELQAVIKSGDIAELSLILSQIAFADFLDNELLFSEDYAYFDEYFSEKVKRPRDLIKYGEHLFEVTDFYYRKAMSQITDTDKKVLELMCYSMWTDGKDWETYIKEKEYLEEYQEQFSDMERKDYRELISKIDWNAFLTAKLVFVNGSEIIKDNIYKIEFDNRRILSRNTRWGKFIIGTPKDDVYLENDDNIAFLIEPGGNDIYYSNFNANLSNPFYMFVDVSGDDVWRNKNVGGLFHVLGGIGWSASLSGNDIYEGEDLAFSSFVGFQYHQKKSQQSSTDSLSVQQYDDYYSTGSYSQSASTFGISINTNDGGNNIYSCTGYGQGFGGTLGVGLLIDYDGHDVYYAGGKYLHKPLRPEDHRSMSQGFGFGVRPDWGGGIGILYDGEGNDSYTGAVYAQGVGYWYALGMLLDGGGNDTFRAVQYSQGSGIHLAGGFLYNESGDDSYYSRFGPGQGAGHDFAVGFLIDRSGDDHYSIDGGNGLGLTNSVGIFLDVEGNDRYERLMEHNYGYGNQARDSGGIGVFLDTGGENLYSDSQHSNDSFWIKGTYGIGLDTTLVAVEEPEKEEEEIIDIEDELATIDTLTAVSELFKISAEWEVGSSVDRVRRARKRILEFDEEAAKYIYENKMDSQSGLEHRAILAFAQSSDAFSEYIEKGMTHEDSLVVKNCIGFAANLGKEELFHYLEEFLNKEMYQATIISALPAFKTGKALEILIPFMDSPSERLRIITSRTLKAMNTEESKELLKKMINDRSFLVRTTVKLTFPDEF